MFFNVRVRIVLTYSRYAAWVKEAGGKVRIARNYLDEEENEKAKGKKKAVDAMEVDDEKPEVVPLRLLKRSNEDQMNKLFRLLFKLPDVIHWYLNEFIFPAYMRHQVIKLSASGQELGGDMLFSRRIGFSGTPSDLLPIELGRCGYEKGSDGKMMAYMTSPEIVSYEVSPPPLLISGQNVTQNLRLWKRDGLCVVCSTTLQTLILHTTPLSTQER